MPKANTRKITAPAAKPVSAKPASDTAVAVAKPVAAATPAVTKPVAATPVVPAVAKPAAHLTRTAATVARQATNFGSLSDRDTAYLGFYRRLANTAPNGVLTVAAIHGSGIRPAHIGSNKPHDAGVIVRLTKAGLIATAADGTSFTITALGRTTGSAPAPTAA